MLRSFLDVREGCLREIVSASTGNRDLLSDQIDQLPGEIASNSRAS